MTKQISHYRTIKNIVAEYVALEMDADGVDDWNIRHNGDIIVSLTLPLAAAIMIEERGYEVTVSRYTNG
ncbi:MAG TPA: hypothetical protein VFQ06_09145, partial [Nitrospira sp.]|nr:hypothetical protein [Nitrospira sp.]